MMGFSDLELGLTPKWFTGKEWASRVAQQECREEYEMAVAKKQPKKDTPPDTEPDWGGKCEVCGESPIVPCTGMCGPCTFGDASTVGGNW